MEWRMQPGGSWLSTEKQLAPDRWVYAVKRPDDSTVWPENGFPWGHVYVHDRALKERNAKQIEHYQFDDRAPLELECVIIAVHIKYTT